MNNQKLSDSKSNIIVLLLAAIFIGGVGLYTENNGFALAGGILLVVTIIMGITQNRKIK